ncbi:hypothetical protein [Chitinivibrio alkaliphilus]|uniref:Uncharacterized protein n=1 Tax=Chitinivibrio alkaliphilus ACht1 TaxID=1313304 RepID=U7D2Z2_9BACT|nr:hypothetical protein [Chitinivibrio alkaliphilus]ERP30849.1 hypothetical protein CALK_2300 [Chitinivibrio alkaliphilus ACht1]
MRESREYYIKVGFSRDAKDIFNEIEQVTARFIRAGWVLESAIVETSLEHITLFFEREISLDKDQ